MLGRKKSERNRRFGIQITMKPNQVVEPQNGMRIHETDIDANFRKLLSHTGMGLRVLHADDIVDSICRAAKHHCHHGR